MAEGHTVIRWARRLKPLVGQVLESVEMRGRWADRGWLLAGQHVTRIETRGKHLLFHLSDGQTIHCHALMYGSWQVGRPGMALRKEERYVRLRLRTARHEVVFFHGPVVEVLTDEELAKHKVLKALGPDILSRSFDRDEAWRRLQLKRAREIGDALIDQNNVAGIGNIYKSEGLFLAGIDPRRPARDVPREKIERLWDKLIPLMWEGVNAPRFVTTLPLELQDGHERNWVYLRKGKPCFRCKTPIEMIRQGTWRRTSYFCPQCQR